jgi:hypothetical protein
MRRIVNVENKENNEHETDDNNNELDDSIFKTQSTFIDINAFEIDIDEILDPSVTIIRVK